MERGRPRRNLPWQTLLVGLLIGTGCNRDGLIPDGPADLSVRLDGSMVPPLGPDLSSARDLSSNPAAEDMTRVPWADLMAPPRFAFDWSIRNKGGDGLEQFVLVDLDGDGKLDIAAASFGHASGMATWGSATVLLGKGDGTFGKAVDYPVTGLRPRGIDVGDFNEDGKLDLALATWGEPNKVAGTVEILLGKGDGTFGAATSLAANGINDWLRVADVDGDKHLDLLVTGYDKLPATRGGALLLRGRGDGSFGKSEPAVSGPDNTAIAISDLDHDGHPDLATILQTRDQVAVQLGKGDGSFGPPVPYPVTAGKYHDAFPFQITSVDIDGDGDTDLVTTNHNNNTVSVLHNDGKGAFGGPTINEVYVPNGSLALGAYSDLDGDGRIDGFLSMYGGYYKVLAGFGNGGFDEGPSERTRGSFGGWVATGDLDGDGKTDAIIADIDAFYTFLNRRP